MRLDRLIRHLLPKANKFLELFERDVENLALCSGCLRRLFETTDPDAQRRLVREIEEFEHAGDEVTHDIFHELGSTFITPIDREDIGALASAMDNIADNMDRAATRLDLFELRVFPRFFVDLAVIIDEAVKELRIAIPLLNDMRDIDRIKEAYVRVNAYENQADLIFYRALESLFREEKDPIALMKKREVLELLETAVDACEDAAVLLENVLVKHA
jgi:predicted phosphate transport protein (TIGR00153 family)